MTSDSVLLSMTEGEIKISDEEELIAPADSSYQIRLSNLLQKLGDQTAKRYSARVYMKNQVNAVAYFNREIRIYSGLMDIMKDDELTAILAHEIGHIELGHLRKKAVAAAYAKRVSRLLLNRVKSNSGAESSGDAEQKINTLVNAQFSRDLEREADLFASELMILQGQDPFAIVRALEKLAALPVSGPVKQGELFIYTHPEPGIRAEEMRQHIQASSAPEN